MKNDSERHGVIAGKGYKDKAGFLPVLWRKIRQGWEGKRDSLHLMRRLENKTIEVGAKAVTPRNHKSCAVFSNLRRHHNRRIEEFRRSSRKRNRKGA